jgi:protein-disulfide isomerase
MGRKEEYRRQRDSSRKRNQSVIIGLIVVAALVVAGLIIIPNLQSIGDVVTVTPNPRPQANGLAMGDPNAPVKVDVYSDFQCPACKSFAEQTEPVLINDYISQGKVYLTYRPFKVIGPESDAAAAAAYCAADQNKFWEYHDMLYANWTGEEVGDFSDRRLKVYAEKIGLDTGTFNQCYNSGKYRAQVRQDQVDGEQLRVSFTPSVFVNGTLITDGSYTATIDNALAGN